MTHGLAVTVGLAALALLAACASAGEQVARGDVVFRADFEGAEALKGWQGVAEKTARLVPGREKSQAVLIENAAGGAPGVSIQIPISVEKLRGVRLRCSSMVKAENVAKPPNTWNGIKFMLHIKGPGGDQWLQQNSVYGTFDWKPVRFSATVPADASDAWLVLGLEQTTGQAWFDDISITVASLPRVKPATPPAGPAYKGHSLARLRGTMINTTMSEADLRVLGEWKANHVRWQLCWNGFPRSPADKGDLDAYDKWLEGALKHLDELLPLCEQSGILVLVDLHTPPGGRNDANDCLLFQEKRFQEHFLKVWDKIAKRYKGNKNVWGYDLVNEPVEGPLGDDVMDWQTLAEKTAKLVRAIDPDHAIIIEPAPWGGPDSLQNLEPINVPGVVYSCHMYAPFQFTHQGVYNNPTGVEYPGMIGGKMWDKEQLRRALKPALDFQKDYGVHMYIGEFSAIRWAPNDSACTYLRDVIDIMEEYGWDWAYHAFREWDGWSVEHGTDKKDNKRSATPTSRQQLLQSWFAKNERQK